MPTIPWEEANRAELFVRSELPTSARRCRESLISRLTTLVENDVLQEYTVTPWAKRVPVTNDADSGEFERETYRTLHSWAQAADVRLSPFFDTRECYSWETGERRTELVLPAACLALYEDDELLAVVPHVDEGGSVSIRDCLDSLENVVVDDEPPVTLTTAD